MPDPTPEDLIAQNQRRMAEARDLLMNVFQQEIVMRPHGPGQHVLDLKQEQGATPRALPDTALVVDQWNRHRAEDLLHASERLMQATGVETVTDHAQAPAQGMPGWDCHTSSTRPRTDGPSYQEAVSRLSDFHAAAYEPQPEMHEACQEERRREFLQNLMETPDYQALHAQTALDPVASELATVAFTEQYAALLKADAEREPGGHPLQGEVDCLAAAGKAAAEAAAEVKDYGEFSRGIGGGGGNFGKRNPAQLMALFQKAKGDRRLKAIMERAGAWRRAAQARQRMKTKHGMDDLVGLRLDGNPALALPSELAQLADPDLEPLALARLTERQWLSRHYQGTEPKGKGPLCIVVDESGSMDNEKGYNAKALGLSLGYIARTQKRWCVLASFSGGTEGYYELFKSSDWGTADADRRVLDWCEHFFGGGTDCDVPCVQLPTVWWPDWVQNHGLQRGRTDLIFLTDAEVNVPDKVIQDFNAFKAREKARLITIILGAHGSGSGQLGRISDEVFRVASLELNSDAVARVLSV